MNTSAAPARIERIGPFVYERHAPRATTAAERGEDMPHDVAIVGGGPVGMAVALGLARHGVRSVIIEADDSVCEGSRAACISRRSLEIVERLGAVEAFMRRGLAWTMGRSFYQRSEVFRFAMPSSPGEKYPPMINLQQYYIEQYLLDAITRCNAAGPRMIDFRWASEVVAFEQDAEGARLRVHNALEDTTLNTRWVVACDGGQSFVRKSLGLELQGTGYAGRYAIIDIELPSGHPTERRAWFDPPWYRGSTILMHRQPDNIWRIDHQLLPGDDPQAVLDTAKLEAFVQRHLDAIGEGHLPWRVVWTSIYRAGAMTLDAYRHGRVLFAGNAAHALPIFGVRGLNSGFDDADNLAWKLAYVAQGLAPDSLLDTYSQERVEAFHTNAAAAMRSTEFMSPPSRGFDLLREACLSLSEAHPPIAELLNPRQTRPVAYQSSTLCTRDAETFDGGLAPGVALADVPSSTAGRHLSDALHARGFTLLVFGDVPDVAQEMGAALQEQLPVGVECAVCMVTRQTIHGAVPDLEGHIHHVYAADLATAYLVRPDGHIAARWKHARPEQVLAAIRIASVGLLQTQPEEALT